VRRFGGEHQRPDLGVRLETHLNMVRKYLAALEEVRTIKDLVATAESYLEMIHSWGAVGELEQFKLLPLETVIGEEKKDG
jgi:hypothetical protein